MRIRDLMTTGLPTLTSEEDLRSAARSMTEGRCKALPVCEGERLVGMITDWDITRAVAEHGEKCTVRDFMSTDLVQAHPDVRLSEAAEIMAGRRLHHLLVSEEGNYRGIVHLDVDWGQFGDETDMLVPTFAAPV